MKVKHNFIRKIFFCILVCSTCCFHTALALYSWKQKATLPGLARHDGAAFAIGNKGYYTTGYRPGAALKDLWEWDLATNVWTQKTDFAGVARYGAFAFAINDKGYCGTGWTYSGNQLKDFYEYDPVTNAWTQKSDFGGVARYDACGLANGTHGYVGFGYSPHHNDWWEYDPVTDTWTVKATFPGSARQSLSGFTIGLDVYIGTGWGGSSYQDLWKYTPSTNSWSQMANFPGAARYATIAFTINSEGYMGSGANYAGAFYQDFYKYDPNSNTWSPIASWPATARHAGDGFSIGVNGYAGLGRGAGNIYYNDYWEYSPDSLTVTAAFTSPTTVCPGTCIDFTNQSQGATSYIWSFPGGNPALSTDANPMSICYQSPGSYDVTLIATSSQSSDTTTVTNYITVYPFPAPQGILQNGDTLFANAGATSYQWYYNGTLIIGATNYYYIGQASGNYNVVATDTNGCEVEAVIYDVIASSQELYSSFNTETTVYPNPFHSKANFILSTKKGEAKVKLEIFNATGEFIAVLFDGEICAGEVKNVELDAKEMTDGIYFYRTTSGLELFNGRLVVIK